MKKIFLLVVCICSISLLTACDAHKAGFFLDNAFHKASEFSEKLNKHETSEKEADGDTFDKSESETELADLDDSGETYELRYDGLYYYPNGGEIVGSLLRFYPDGAVLIGGSAILPKGNWFNRNSELNYGSAHSIDKETESLLYYSDFSCKIKR